MITEQAKTYSHKEVDALIEQAVERAIRQDREFVCQIIRALPRVMDAGIRQGWIENPIGLQEFMGRLNPPEESVAAPEVPIDPIIRVDRSVRIKYPDWVRMANHPELEHVGPAEYDITKSERWFHNGQKDGKRIKGNEIYAYLKETDTLKICFGLRDLEEIQKKGVVFFRKYFKGEAVFGWSSIAWDYDGALNVPYLCEMGFKVDLGWHELDTLWHTFDPALRYTGDFAKSPNG